MLKIPKPIIWASWIVIGWGLSEIKPFLVPVLLAALLSFLVNPLINFLERKKIPEWASISLSSIVLLLPIFILVGILINQGTVLVKDVPHLKLSIKNLLESISQSSLVQGLNLAQYLDIDSLTSALSDDASESLSAVLFGLRALIAASAHLLIILIFSIVMLASRKQLRKSAERLLVAHPETLNQIINLIEKFLIAKIGIAGIIAFTDFFILKSFETRYNVLFAVVLGFSTFIPAVGFPLALLPPLVTALALGHSLGNVISMSALLYIVSSIEGHFITPKYLGRRLNLNLFVTFLGLFAGELMWGIWGMVLAVPILGIIRIILNANPEYQHYAQMMSERSETVLKD
jgi:predicted PurR-regulated permease PerM